MNNSCKVIGLSGIGRRLLLFAVLFCAALAAAPVGAQTVNQDGMITSRPWQEGKYHYIQINRVNFMFMPKVQVDARFTGYQEQPVTPGLLSHFAVGDKVTIAKQGFRIYRVYFYNK